jgi:hypothetical protein
VGKSFSRGTVRGLRYGFSKALRVGLLGPKAGKSFSRGEAHP